jgi:hypothetical protein
LHKDLDIEPADIVLEKPSYGGDSAQTLVAMPVMITLSMPRERKVSSRPVPWKAAC